MGAVPRAGVHVVAEAAYIHCSKHIPVLEAKDKISIGVSTTTSAKAATSSRLAALHDPGPRPRRGTRPTTPWSTCAMRPGRSTCGTPQQHARTSAAPHRRRAAGTTCVRKEALKSSPVCTHSSDAEACLGRFHADHLGSPPERRPVPVSALQYAPHSLPRHERTDRAMRRHAIDRRFAEGHHSFSAATNRPPSGRKHHEGRGTHVCGLCPLSSPCIRGGTCPCCPWEGSDHPLGGSP